MSRFAWLMRREFWEHRAIWIAPAVVLGLLLLGAVTGNVFMGEIRIDADTEIGGAPVPAGHGHESAGAEGSVRVLGAGEALELVPPEKREGLLAVIYAAVAGVMFVVLGSIGFVYSLDALYADRRDRSVLFWKSLPLSDTETVLAKFCVAAVAIPVLAAAASIAGQLIIATGGSVKLALTGGDAALMWLPHVIGGGAAAAVMMAVICAFWYAPVTAYLLLASAWAPKSPFLWAVLPPIALSMLEKIAFGSNHVSEFLKDRMGAPLGALFNDDNVKSGALQPFDLAAGIADLLASPGTLLGLVGAAALLAAAIWVRRYRDETT
jgi:ABC-2 type transport system permease protein